MLNQLLDPHVLDTRTPAIGYIRVSLAREEMISPELQRASIEEWARRTGHRIIDWVIDLDKTGRNFKRRIMSVIERIEDGEAKVIAVWKYSRFGRSSEGTRVNLARVERAGGQVLTSAETVDTSTPEGRLQRGMILEFNSYESDRAGVQWEETHEWRRQNGLPATGKDRFGYIWHPRKRFNPDGTVILQEERYEPDPILGPALTSAYERFVDGDSFRSIALWMNRKGFRTTRDDHWSSKALIRVMDSGFAAGYLRLHAANCPKPECYGNCTNYELVKHPEKHHPTLISEEAWSKYQKARGERRSLPPRSRSAKYPLTGLIRCGRCNAAAKRAVPGRSRPGPINYVCVEYSDKGKVACVGTREHESNVVAGIKGFLQRVAAEIHAAAEVKLVRPVHELPTQKGEKELLREKITRLEKAITKHMRANALNDDDDPAGVTEAEYRSVLKEFCDEKSAAEARLAKVVEESATDPARDKLNAVHVAVGLLEEWPHLPPERLNFLLRQVVEKVVLRPDGALDVHPAWSADEPWTAPRAEKPLSKADAVRATARTLRSEGPRVTSQRISDDLALRGTAVTASYVRYVLNRDAKLAQQRFEEGSDPA